MEDIITNSYVLTPGRFVGVENELDDGIPFEEKFHALKNKLVEQFEQNSKLEKQILKNLKNID